MAETPNIPDMSNLPQQINDAIAAFSRFTQTAENAFAKLAGLGGKSFDTFKKEGTEAFNKINQESNTFFSNFMEKVKASNAEFKKMTITQSEVPQHFKNMLDGAKALLAVTTNIKPIHLTDIRAGDGILTLKENIDGLAENGVNVSAILQRVSGIGGEWGKKIAEGGAAALSNFISHVEAGQKLEQQLIAQYAAAGRLNQLYDVSGAKLKDLSTISTLYAKGLGAIAGSTNLTIEKVSRLISEFGRYGATASINTIATEKISDNLRTNFGPSLSIAELQIRTLNATGLSAKEMASSLSNSFQNLAAASGKLTEGEQQLKAITYLSTMSNLSNELGIQFEDLKDVMDNISSAFKNIGDNTEASARILARYQEALRETGLTSKQTTQLIGNMIQNVARLNETQNLGSRAFLSARTGGPGGLAGAYQIENLLRQGKSDEVVKLIERNIRQQIGGRIVTLAEASRSQTAAAEFTRQRAIVTSSGFGGLVNQENAGRFLEVLAKGRVGKGSEVEKLIGVKGLEGPLNKSVSIQERYANVIGESNRALNQIQVSTAISAASAVQALKMSPGTITDQIKDVNKIQEQVSQMLNTARGEEITPNQASLVGELTDLKSVGQFGNALEQGFSKIISGVKPEDQAPRIAQLPSPGARLARDATRSIQLQTARTTQEKIRSEHNVNINIKSDVPVEIERSESGHDASGIKFKYINVNRGN